MIPDYQSIMLPLLEFVSDGNEHRITAIIDALGSRLGLTDEERNELLPSGKQTTFSSRVQWARTYLVQAKLLEPTRRAHLKITERGSAVLKEQPRRVDNRLLERFPEFIEFKGRIREKDPLAAADLKNVRAGPGCLTRFSASISGASAGVRLPSGLAAG